MFDHYEVFPAKKALKALKMHCQSQIFLVHYIHNTMLAGLSFYPSIYHLAIYIYIHGSCDVVRILKTVVQCEKFMILNEILGF